MKIQWNNLDIRIKNLIFEKVWILNYFINNLEKKKNKNFLYFLKVLCKKYPKNTFLNYLFNQRYYFVPIKCLQVEELKLQLDKLFKLFLIETRINLKIE